MMTALLIDPDSYWRELGANWLREDGYTVIVANDGFSGLRQLFNYHPDAAIVDVSPSGPDRWDTVRRVREVSNMPLIAISATADEVSLRKAFDLGVDGYIVKPFEQSELLERLGAVLRRVYHGNGHNGNGTVFHQDGLSIDWRSHEVRVDEQPIHLTATEFRLLSLLVERRGWVLTHDQILSQVWGSNHLGDRNNVKLYVWYLRQKIEANPAHPRWIRTKRGIGYCFAA
jgi:two-component system KDP operon response regulator KdpE